MPSGGVSGKESLAAFNRMPERWIITTVVAKMSSINAMIRLATAELLQGLGVGC